MFLTECGPERKKKKKKKVLGTLGTVAGGKLIFL